MPTTCPPPPDLHVGRAPSAYYRGAADVEAFSASWRTNFKEWLSKLETSAYRSATWVLDEELAALDRQLETLWLYPDDWDTYGAPAPAPNALLATYTLLKEAFAAKTLPSSIVASADGGVAAHFFKDEKAAYIEYRNCHEAVLVMYDRDNDPVVHEIDEGAKAANLALRTIGEYLN